MTAFLFRSRRTVGWLDEDGEVHTWALPAIVPTWQLDIMRGGEAGGGR